MQKSQSDLELIFKKRARRRLVGAIALVLLMIVVLPIILEDRVETRSQQEIAIVMPDKKTSDEAVVSEELITINDLNAGTVSETKMLALQEVESTKPKVEPAKPPKTTGVAEPKKESAKKVDIISATYPFYVQIGVFSDVANVKKLQVKLDELGYQTVSEKMTTETGEKIRLRTVNFEDRNEAAIALENIKDAGLTGMVVSQK